MNDDTLTTDTAMMLAERQIEEGKPEAAIETYRGILAKYPKHQKALKGLKYLEKTIPGQSNGANFQADMEKLMELYTSQKLDQAMTQAKTLCKRCPDQPMPFNIMGVIQAYRGNNDEAVQNYVQALAIAPEYLDAHNNLGAALHSLGKYEEAISSYQKATRINPRDADAFFNTGNSFMSLGRPLQAIECYKTAVAIRPLHVAAHYSLGTAFKDLGQLKPSLESYNNAASIDPKFVDAHMRIGDVLRELNMYDGAIASYINAIKVQADHVDAHKSLGTTLLQVNRREEATAILNAGLTLRPDSQEMKHFLNAARNIASDIAPRSYVENLFDDYAANFDEHLVANLGYQGPETLRQLVTTFGNINDKVKSAIDLGCGTGLSGEAFRDTCISLEGIDLSSKMLERAAQKSVYDRLHCGDVTTVLEQLDKDYELFICADLLVYIGNLAPLINVIAKHSQPGTLLTFSTEHILEGDFELRASGRYAHSKEYVVRTASAAGFELVSFKEGNLRKSDESWINGGNYLLKYTA